MTKANAIKSAKVIEVIKITALRGDGTEKDPTREIIQYWDLQGKPLAESDPCQRELISKEAAEFFNGEPYKFDKPFLKEQPTRATRKETDDIDKTISNICTWIDGVMERTSCTADPTPAPGMAEALAKLVSARDASKEMTALALVLREQSEEQIKIKQDVEELQRYLLTKRKEMLDSMPAI